MSLEPFSTNEPDPFDDFAEADLLDLIEGTMTPERARELAELIRNKRPDLLGVLTRMQADRLALESHLDMEPPRDLVSDIAAAPQPRSVHEREYQEAAEPTVMMERAVRNLGRRRRRRRQAPYIAAIAAGIAGIGITAAIVVLVEELGRSTQPPSSATSTQLAAGESVPQAIDASARDAVVAEYGLVVRGVDASAFGTDLANLLAFGDAVVVETLALDEGVRNRTGGNASLRAAIQAGDRAIIHESEMLPPPLVGSME